MTTELAIRPDQTRFDENQLAAVRALGAEDAPAGDVAMLFHQSVRMGLDPFAKQIYLIGRDERRNVNGNWQTVGKKWTIQTGIDGFRVIRDRSGTYDGMELAWCGPDGRWVDVWTKNEPPFAARALIYVKGRSRPEPAIAYFSEYAQTDRNGNPQAMWKTRPAGQLAKCAEALGLRRAYPQDLSGIYTDDEMQQADRDADGVYTATTVPPAQQEPVRRQTQLAGHQDAAQDPEEQGNLWLDRIMSAADLDALRTLWARVVQARAQHLPTRAGVTVAEAKDARKEALEQPAEEFELEEPPEEPV